MSRNGSGTYNLPAGNPVVTGTTISTTWANTTLTDIGSALTGSVASDGQTPMTGVLNMNSNAIANLANPTANQDAATKVYVDTNALLKANNLSDVANATTSRTNLSAAKSGANSDITSITGLTTPLTVAQGGIGAATLTANNVLLGNGTSAVQVVAPSTAGNVLTSNGTTWTSAVSTSVTGANGQVFTANGTFTIPTGITRIKVTVQSGGGGGGGANLNWGTSGGGGGGGANAVTFYTGLTPANTLSVTVGGGGTAGTTALSPTSGTAGGTSSITSGTQSITATTCTGGGAGIAGAPSAEGTGGAGGTATGGSFAINGSNGGNGDSFIVGFRGESIMTTNLTGYGLGGTGGTGGGQTVSAGTAGIVIVEW